MAIRAASPLPDVNVRRGLKTQSDADLPEKLRALPAEQRAEYLSSRNILINTINNVLLNRVVRYDHRFDFADAELSKLDTAAFSTDDKQRLILELGQLEGEQSTAGITFDTGGWHQKCAERLKTRFPLIADRMAEAKKFAGVGPFTLNPEWKPASP